MSDNSNVDSGEATDPTYNAPSSINYSRWMTDMAAEIGHLKLHQLAIPGAHNSGVDRAGKFEIFKKFAACQDNSFYHQLSAGARYLDLRLVDSSYKKDVGGGKVPRYRFVEVFEFKHNIVSVGRTLDDMVLWVRTFSMFNPGEIIIIDFRIYDRGRNYSHTSLERCLAKLSPLKNLLIPNSAYNMSLAEIRQKHPGCNIVLGLDHKYPKPQPAKPGDPPPPDKWPGGTVTREQIWQPLHHVWTTDADESRVENLVSTSMTSPPLIDYWVLSAAVTKHWEPHALPADHKVRTEAFRPGYQNVKIHMVDFIERDATRVGVVDRCITLNKLRATDKTPPAAPTNLVVTARYGDTGSGHENRLIIKWTPAVDNLGVRLYEIYCDGVQIATTSSNPYWQPNPAMKNYRFKVRAIDNSFNVSEFSDEFFLVQDDIPPTTPGKIELQLNLDGTFVTAVWDHSEDNAGLDCYEVYLDGAFLKSVPYVDTRRVFTEFRNLSTTRQYEIQIRAKDINELFSEFSTITLYPRPRLINPRYSIVGYDESTEKYSVNVVWETDSPSSPEISYEGETKWYSGHAEYRDIYYPQSGEGPVFNFEATQFEEIKHRCITWYGRYPVSSFTSFDFVFDATPPRPISNLKLESRTLDETTISWTPSPDSNIQNYAISINEAPPVLVAKEARTHTFEEMPFDQDQVVEVWAINNTDAASTVESLTIYATVPSKPDLIQIARITTTSAELFWGHSAGAVAGYSVIVNDGQAITIFENRHFLTHLAISTLYTIDIRALDHYGNASEPSSTSFNTFHLGRPGTPIITNSTSTSVIVDWPPSEDNGAVTGYDVVLDNNPLIIVPGTTHTFTGLKDKTTYSVHIRVRDAFGNRSEPSSASFTTKDVTPPSAPGRFTINNITSSTAEIRWMASTGDIDYYEFTLGTKQPIFIRTNSQFPNGLTEGTSYDVRVRAQDAVGNFSAPSFASFITKTTRPPSQPGVPVITDITDTSARLNWTPAQGLNVRYTVWINGSRYIEKLNATNLELRNLKTDTEHVIELAATNEAGATEPTSSVFRTRRKLPASPTNFRYTQQLDTTILEWDPSNEAELGYRVILMDAQGKEFRYLPVEPLMRERLPSASQFSVRITARAATEESLPLISELATE